MRVTLLLFLAALQAGCVTTAPSSPGDDAVREVQRLTRETCGATYNLKEGDRARTGVYVVSVYPEGGRGEVLKDFPTDQQLKAFIDRNADLLQSPTNDVGTYCEREQGDCLLGSGQLTCYLDVSRTVKTPEQASRLAVACNQKSIARLGKDGVEILDSVEGKGFGDGKPIVGEKLEACKKERGL